MVLKERSKVTALRRLGRYGHLAVYPYPRELEERVTLRDGTDLPYGRSSRRMPRASVNSSRGSHQRRCTSAS